MPPCASSAGLVLVAGEEVFHLVKLGIARDANILPRTGKHLQMPGPAQNSVRAT